MNQFYTKYLILTPLLLFISLIAYAQPCAYQSHTANMTACGDGSTTTTIVLTFDVPMAGAANVILMDAFDASTYVGTNGVPGANDVSFSFSLSHSGGNTCAAESHIFSIDPTSVCSDGSTLVTVGAFTETITVFPNQPSWEIAGGSDQVCSQGTITINILGSDGSFCTSTTITAPQNQGCTNITSVQVDLDYETLLGIFGPVGAGCWANVSGMFTMDPSGASTFTVFPEQPTWQIIAGDETLCSQGTMDVEIFAADLSSCGTTSFMVPQNQGCTSLTMLNISGLIDFEALLGITGPIGEGCWTNPSGTISADDAGTTFEIFPEQPSWRITPGMNAVCSAVDFSIDILDAAGNTCTTTTVTGLTNQGCTIMDMVSVNLDYETLLGIAGADAEGCWTDVSGTFSMDPAGTSFQVFPEQPTWQIAAGDEEECSLGSFDLEFYIAGNLCGTQTINAPANQTCDVINDVDVGQIDFETNIAGAAGAIAAGCWTNPSGTVTMDPLGTSFYIYPDQFSYQITPGMDVICDGAAFSIDILNAAGGTCSTVTNVTSYTPATGCLIENNVTVNIDYETYLIAPTGPIGPDGTGCFTDVSTTVTADPGGTTFTVLPQQLTWEVDTAFPNAAVCGDGAATVDVVVVGSDNSCRSATTMITVPQNTTCMVNTTYPVVISLADMETMLSFPAGVLTGGQTCIAAISTDMSLSPTTVVEAQPDHNLVSWRVAAGMPNEYCSGIGMIDIEVLVNGVACFTQQFAIPPNRGCMVATSLPFTITAAEIETGLGILAPFAPSCYTDIVDNVNMDPGGYILQILPAPFTIQDATLNLNTCSDTPNAITINLVSGDGTVCGTPFLFNAPSNLGCGVVNAFSGTITVANIEVLIGLLPPASGAACYSDIVVTEGDLAGTLNVFPAMPTGANVTVLNPRPCSEDVNVLSVDLIAADGTSNCPAGLMIDAPLVDGCMALTSLDFTISVAQIEIALGVPPGTCTFYTPLPISFVIPVSPAQPSGYQLAGPVPGAVCSGAMNPVTVNIIAADGTTVCDAVQIPIPINDGCEPLLQQPLTFLYTAGQWLATTMGADACGFSNFVDSYLVDVYPEPFTLDSMGGGECVTLLAELVAADGTTCYTQMKACSGDTDFMDFDFNDPAAAALYGDLIPWNVNLWPAPCNPGPIYTGSMECRNCPEICSFAGAYPYWTTYCPDAHILCDPSQLAILSCTPPTIVENDDCEPEGNLCNGPSTADNMSWFAFIAGSTVIDINVLLLNCISGNPSFQAGLWDECICNGGSCLVGQSSPCGTNIDLLLTNAVIGETYYIFVDGCAGSQCNFQITIAQAPPFTWECPVEPEVDGCLVNDISYPPNTYCIDQSGLLTIFADMPQYADFIGTLNSTFSWSITSPGGVDPIPFDQGNPLTINDPFISLEIYDPNFGMYSLCFEGADNDCDDTSDCAVPQCYDFNVVKLEDQDWGVHDVCFDVLEQEGYFPVHPNFFWQGPPIYTWDLDFYGNYTYIAANACGCSFEQVITINIIDQILPVPYTVYLCEDDPCWIIVDNYGPIQYCIDDALGELVWLPGLAPSGCDLPVLLTVLGLIIDGDVDTISASCNSIELEWVIDMTIPPTFDRDDMTFVWTNSMGDTLGTDPRQLFTLEETVFLEVKYWAINEFNERTECVDNYSYVISFDDLVIAPPTFVDPVLELCPGIVQTIDYVLFDRGDNNTWTSQPPGLITNISGPLNNVATVDWVGVSGGRLCAVADNDCDGVITISEETCIDIIVTPALTYSLTVQDTICELLDSVLVTFNGDIGAIDSIAWDNGDTTQMVYYDLTASDAYQVFEVFVIDTFGCFFPVVSDSVYVDAENFLTISVPQPSVCLDGINDVSFLVSTTGPGTLTAQAGLDVATGIFDPAVVGAGIYIFEFIGNPTEGCVAETVTTQVEVIETPQPAFTLPASICLGDIATVTVNPADTIGGIVFDWQTPNAVSDYSGDNTSFNLTYTNTGVFDVTLITSLAQCASQPLTQQVEVRDTLTFPPFSCIGQGTDFIDFEWSIPAGVTNFDISWTINGNPAGNSSGPDNTLSVTMLSEDDEVIVTVTAIDPNNCEDKTQVAICVALNCPSPGLNLPMPTDICLDGSVTSITLVPEWLGPDPAPAMGDGAPIGFSGPGVDPVTGVFTPTTSGVFDITYQYRNEIGCLFFATTPVTVFDLPSADLVSADTICLGEQLALQFNGNTVGVDFTWDFDSDIFNDQSPTNNSDITVEWDTPGTKTITVNTVLNTTTTLCEANALKEVVVLDTIPAPVFDPCGTAGREFVTFSWQPVFSVNDNIQVTEYMVTVDGVPLGIQDSTNLVVTGLAEAQQVTITVTALDPNGCKDQTSTFTCESLFCRHDYIIPLSPAAVLCSNVDVNQFTISADLSMIPANELGSGAFTIDPANGMIDDQGTFDPSGLAAGVYTVEYIFTNIIGCVDPFYVDITIFDEPSANFVMPLKVCLGEDARVLYGGDPSGVTFTWDIGTGVSPDLAVNSQAALFNISWSTAGIQSITLTTERDGCVNSFTNTIEVVGPPQITLSGPNGPTCFDSSLGIQLGASVITQTGVFTGSWIDPTVDANGSFFPPNGNNATYTLTYEVTEEPGCVTTETIDVEVLASPTVDVTVVTSPICVNGVATVEAFATGFTSISWDLDGGTLESGDITGTGPLQVSWPTDGTYTLTATAENGICTSSNSDQVVVEPRLDLLNIQCDEEITSITFSWTPVDCVSEYIIEVDGVIVETNYTGTSYVVDDLTEEQMVDFVVTTLSMCACPGDRNPANCTSLPCPDYSVDFSQDVIGFCFGENVNVDLNPNQSPPVNPADGQVVWSGPGVNQNGQFNSLGINPGEYNLIYSYTEGICGFQDTVVVQVSGIPQINTEVQDPVCYLDRFGIVIPEIVDGFGPFTAQITGSNNFNLIIDPVTVVENIPPGSYQMIVTDNNGCTNIATFQILDVIEPSTNINGADIQTVGIPENYTFDVDPESYFANISFDSIVWTLNGAVFCSGLECLDVILDEDEDALDTLCVQLFYNDGCFIESCKPVRIREIKQFYIPNIFSPNNDSNNEDLRFYTNNESAIVHDVSIYDRWGNLVHSRVLEEIVGTETEVSDNDPAKNDVYLWDGLYGDRQVQPGVYVYKVNYTLDPVNGGLPEVVAGDVTVIR